VYGSLKIGNAFGIPVRIHATFLVLVYVLVILAEEPLAALTLIGVSFGCVLLHELGHSLVARGFGLRVVDITLWPLGGLARMSEIPENPRIEGLIAIAGPAVNFALAGIALLALVLATVLGLEDRGGFGLVDVPMILLVVNLLQGGFNLVPAFPMDGGRLLRAFLGRKRDWVSATELAVRVGRVALFVLVVVWLGVSVRFGRDTCIGPLMTLAMALFIYMAGTRELVTVRLRHGVSPFGAAFGTWEAGGSGSAAPADDAGSARRPFVWIRRQVRRGGFSEAEIRQLESYRGPLRRPPEE
jgi:Zn-dependent protease